MIRRSTFIFLTCLAALGTSAVRTPAMQSNRAAAEYSSEAQVLIAQASGGTAASELSLNSRGEAVKALQVRLQKSSYYSGSIDGLYGLATQRAVSAFQADAGLSQTGSLSEETWQRLQALSNASSPSASAEISADTPTTTLASASVPEAVTVADELPPIDAEEGNAVVAPEGKEGGLGKAFGLGLGAIAVLASFGIGFYLANRDKANELEEGEWGEIEPDSGQRQGRAQPIAPAVGQQTGLGGASRSTLGNSLNSPLNGSPSNSQSSSPMSNSASNGAMTHSGSISSIAASPGQALSTNRQMGGQITGQMGGAAPLTQVDIIDGLVGDLRNPDPARRRKAIWELGQRGNSLAMQPLVDSMIDADSKEKSLVLAALSEIGIRSLKPMSRALAIALQDDNPEVRKNAIRDLTRVYDLVVQISQMLGHATEDEDPEVRQTATWALEQLSRIRRSQDIDTSVRTFSGGSAVPPIDLLSSEASLRRSQQGLS